MIKFRITIILIISVLIYNIEYLCAEKLFLNNGKEYKGKLQKIENQKLEFLDYNSNQTLNINISEVKNISFQKERQFNEIVKVSDLHDTIFLKYFSVAADEKIYPDAGYAVLYKSDKYTNINAGYWKHEKIILKKIIQKRAESEGIVRIYYKEKTDTVVIDFAITVSGGSVNSLDDNALKDEYIVTSSKYKNLKQLRFSLPKTGTGSYIYYKYTRYFFTDRKNPFYVSETFASEEPVIYAETVFEYPKKTDLKYLISNNTQKKIKVSKEKNNAYKYIKFYIENDNGYTPEKNMPVPEQIFPGIKVYQYKGKYRKIFSHITEKINSEYPDIIKLKNQILGVKRIETDFDKIVLLYEYLAKNIQTADLNFRMNEYDFNHPEQIISDMTASNYDKVFLLSKLLSAAGIKNEIVFVKKFYREKKYGRIYNIKFYDDVICIAYADNREYYLYPSSPYRPVNVIPSEYKGVLGLSAVNFKSKKIPEFENSFRRNIDFEISENNSLLVNDTMIFRSGSSSFFRYLKNQPTDIQIQSVVSLLSREFDNINVDTFYLSENRLDTDFYYCTFRYRINNFVIAAGNRLKAFKIPGFTLRSFDYADKIRNFDVNLDEKYYEKIIVTLKLNSEQQIYSVPDKRKYSDSDMEYGFSVEFFDNKIIIASENKLKSFYIKKQNYVNLQKFSKLIFEEKDKWILIQ